MSTRFGLAAGVSTSVGCILGTGYCLGSGWVAESTGFLFLASLGALCTWTIVRTAPKHNHVEHRHGLTEEIDRQRHEIRFAELALAEKERQIDEMFERLETAKQYARNARRLQEIASRRFEELFHGLPVACFTCGLDGIVYDCSRSAELLWGVSSLESLQRPITELMHGDQAANILSTLLAKSANGETVEMVEFEVVVAEEDRRWVLASVFPLASSEGEVTGSVWAVLDDTERKKQADRLAESESRFRTSLEAMQCGVMVFDQSGRLNVANPRAAEILGWNPFELMASPNWYEKLGPHGETGEPIHRAALPLSRSLTKSEKCSDVTLGTKRPDGSSAWISVNSAPILNGTDLLGVVVTFVDISQQLDNARTIEASMRQIQLGHDLLEEKARELADANQKLSELASTDGLTGIMNQRSFHEFLKTQFLNAKRYHLPLSLMIIDVDFFKLYNDAFGHPAGDDVLKQVANILSQEARAGDFVSRCGGEEFAVVLPNTDDRGAFDAAERIRIAIENAVWEHRPVTVSIGTSTIEEQTESQDRLFEQADQALYASKGTGRNRTTRWNDVPRAA